MSWTAGQQAMLEAMGFTLFRRAGAGEPAMPATAGSTPVAAASAAAIRGDARDCGTGRDGADADGDRLLQALRRAAGGRDLSGLALPPLDELRRSARAKRALWPRLRALRRH